MPRKAASTRRATIGIVGPGNLGTALAITLSAARYPVKFLDVRADKVSDRKLKALARKVHARLVVPGRDPLGSDIVWLTVPDDAIAAVAAELADVQAWKGKLVFHSSGALSSDELAPLRERGARVASVHPLMTFVRGAVPRMAGVPFALEGDAAAVRAARKIVEELGARAFTIKKQNKVLYHAFGSFASPQLIALMAAMERVGMAAGIHPKDIKPVMLPLLQQTLRNYLDKTAAEAFSGPLMRGDVATVRRHLVELKVLPEVRELYVALAKASLQNLPVKNRSLLAKELLGS